MAMLSARFSENLVFFFWVLGESVNSSELRLQLLGLGFLPILTVNWA